MNWRRVWVDTPFHQRFQVCARWPAPSAHSTLLLAPSRPPLPAPAQTFKRVVSLPNAQKTSLTWHFSAFGKGRLWIALITFLYLDFLDATGTM